VQSGMGAEVERVEIVLSVFDEVAPQRDGFGFDRVVFHFDLAVAQEVAIEVGLGKLSQVVQISVVEFEISGVLIEQLADTVQKLEEDR